VTQTVVVMAKSPEPGRVKTRLTPALSPAAAAALAAAALADTLDVVLATPATRRVLALDGPVGPWLPPGVEVMAQEGDGLAERIASVIAAVSGPVMVIGMDTPQVTPALLGVDWAGEEGTDAVLGPATDGGYWALGLRRPDPDLVRGIPMSVPHTGREQRARLTAAGLRVVDLPMLTDVDTLADVGEVAALIPDSRFAALSRAAEGRQFRRRVGAPRVEGGRHHGERCDHG
jgi:hypothetical protein